MKHGSNTDETTRDFNFGPTKVEFERTVLYFLFLSVLQTFYFSASREDLSGELAGGEPRMKHGSDMVFSNSAPHRRLTYQRHVYLPGNALENATPTLLTSDKTTRRFCGRASFCILSVFYPCFIRVSSVAQWVAAEGRAGFHPWLKSVGRC
ncbi:MAG TPA: hypothetical protein VMV10_32750 [Pirellulales bacterium]|nr:hypothetical protein [Pirellulales bacterium]